MVTLFSKLSTPLISSFLTTLRHLFPTRLTHLEILWVQSIKKKLNVHQTISMVISEMLYSSLEGALEIRNIFVATVTAIQFSKEILSWKPDCVTEVKDEA